MKLQYQYLTACVQRFCPQAVMVGLISEVGSGESPNLSRAELASLCVVGEQPIELLKCAALGLRQAEEGPRNQNCRRASNEPSQRDLRDDTVSSLIQPYFDQTSFFFGRLVDDLVSQSQH